MRFRNTALLAFVALVFILGTVGAQELPVSRLGQVEAAQPGFTIVGTPGRPETYGGSNTSYQLIGSTEFTPLASATSYNDDGNTGVLQRRFSTVANGEFVATPHLPGGALLTYVELDYCDTNAAGTTTLFLYDCSYLGDCSALPPLAVLTSSDGGCSSTSANLTPLNYSVNNFFNKLLLYANTSAGNNTTSLSAAILGYRLQVSPAPAVATFGDVPTSHPFFQFIEALAASGITAGCGGGNFCPNNPLTRGQMAVFLSLGLGLQFP